MSTNEKNDTIITYHIHIKNYLFVECTADLLAYIFSLPF